MNAIAELVALLVPPGCLACRCALPRAGERLCVDCSRALPWLRAGCRRCGLPVHRGKRCPAARAAFPRAWAPLAYQGVARKLVAALKFRGALAAADVMAAHIAANLPPDLRAAPAVLVPVPPVGRRRRRRGFDPGAGTRRRARAPDRAAARRVPGARRPRGAPGGREPPRAAARLDDSRSACAAHRRRSRSSSTTSTRRARRWTPALARSRPRGRLSWPRSPTPARSEG